MGFSGSCIERGEEFMVPNLEVDFIRNWSNNAMSFLTNLQVSDAPVLWEKRKAKAVEEQS